MTGYIKYFVNGGKNMSSVIKDDDVLEKYYEIWDKIKETLCIKFHSTPVLNWKKYYEIWDKIKETFCIKFHSTLVHDEKYIKAKVREFSGVIKTNFLGDEVTLALHLHCLYNY